MKTFVFFIALFITLLFVNNKFSTSVRVIAFSENETKLNAIASMVLMILVTIAWTVFFSMF